MDNIRKEITDIHKQMEALKDGEYKLELDNRLKVLEKTQKIYTSFEIACDGFYPYTDDTIGPSTFDSGVCKIKYFPEKDILHVWLRRPGVFIGKSGQTINAIQDYIGCKIHITEVKRLWDWE